MPALFYTGTDYECSSGPYVNRKAVTADLWPEGGGQATLLEGDHPFLAFGRVADRPNNVVGVVITYNTATDQAVLNVAPGFIAKSEVCNISGYSGAVANAWAAALDNYEPVWIDDSTEVGPGATLSRSAANSAGALNPMAGMVWPDQDEFDDSGVGGVDGDPFPVSFSTSSDEAWLTVCVMLWPNNED